MAKLRIERIVRDDSCDYYTKNRFVVYAPAPDRPFDNGDIAGDFAWRREHKPPKIKEEVLDALEPLLALAGTNRWEASIRYDRYAGCKMCPCSPGFVVSIPVAQKLKFDIWLEYEKTAVAQ